MNEPLERIKNVLEAALLAADPEEAVKRSLRMEGESLHAGGAVLPLCPNSRIVAVGGGKGCAPMALALERLLGARLDKGLVNVKRGHTGRGGSTVRFGRAGAVSTPPAALERIELVEASHPFPDEAGREGAARMLALMEELGEDDLAIVLLSGGGSALLTLPPEELSLEAMWGLNAALLASGAEIGEINAVRKHCSRIAGGQLAGACRGRTLALILSDVVGSPLDVIASGPTAPDPTTFADALSVIRKRGLATLVDSSILRRLEAGAKGEVVETPKEGDAAFGRTLNIIIGENRLSITAALKAAKAEGFAPLGLGSAIECEAREMGKAAVGLGLSLARGELEIKPPACIIFGGESTVTIKGRGKGGRNQEAALAAAIALHRKAKPDARMGVFFLGTDGNDGPTDAAGAFATPKTVSQGNVLGLDAAAMLEENDSYSFFNALGSLIVTGPTNTNVNDLAFIFAW